MKIQNIELREIQMPLVHFFETSFGRTTLRRIVLVRVDCDGVTGWGEVTAGESPFYSYETTDTAWHILRDFLIPWALKADWAEPSDIAALFKHVRGHHMAKAALENALWDIRAQQLNVPLAKLVGGVAQEISCGVSLGIQNSIEELLAKIDVELAAGYQRIKVKVKPGWDLKVLEAIRNRHPRISLMADANCAYTLVDFAHLKDFDPFCLMMIEQPLGWEDMLDHATLQRQLSTPICLDESIHTADDARKAIHLRAGKIINIKLGRVGGFTEARLLHNLCVQKHLPVWCGGMLESGIGRAHNIAMSAMPGFSLPGDVSASKRYWHEDIVEPEIEVTPRGTILVPTTPGLGYRPKLDRIEAVTVRKESFA